MKLNYLVCAVWCIIFHGVCGQLSGDPAPGRSPGPPTTSAVDSAHFNSSESNSKSTINEASIGNDEARKSSNEIQVPQTSNRKLSSASAGARTVKQRDYLDKLSNEFVKMTDESFRSNRKPCTNISVTEYLLMETYSPKIVKVELPAGAEAANSGTASANHHPISVDVTHDAFDLRNGLVPNVIYTGESFLIRFSFYAPRSANERETLAFRSPAAPLLSLLASGESSALLRRRRENVRPDNKDRAKRADGAQRWRGERIQYSNSLNILNFTEAPRLYFAPEGG